MSTRDRIDPESRGPLEELLPVMRQLEAISDIVERRVVAARIFADLPVAEHPGAATEDRTVPGPPGAPDVAVRVYRPVRDDRPAGGAASALLPGIYFIHGGGMVLGDIDGEDADAAMLSEQVGAVVVSVGYRLAPEHPHPAPSQDCYAGLVWMAEHAEELGVDSRRLAVYGGSAGGGLTIATALLARDRGGPSLAFMMPIYPMIDDANTTPSSHEITDVGIWDRATNIEAWDAYLGGRPADAYAAPARAEDLSGLPPAFIDVGTVDAFRDEDITFAQRLMQAGVPCELHVYPGAYHASETFSPDAALSRRIWATRIEALRRALAG